MNVVVITLDQFRGDHLGVGGHPLARTPGLDDLAAHGVRFARHHAQAAPCGPGRASLYTGTYQMNHRVVANGSPLDDRFDNVARLARRAGYDPTLFGYTDQTVDPRTVADPTDPRLSTYEGVLPGFRVGLDLTGSQAPWRAWLDAQGHAPGNGAGDALRSEPDRPAEVGISAFLTDRFLEWSAARDEPWFAHLSYLRPHPPYAAAGEWSTAFSPEEVDLPVAPGSRGDLLPLHRMMLDLFFTAAPTDEGELRRMRAQYLGMVGDVDAQLQRIWAALRERGQWDDTVVVVTADHGDQLGDQGLVEKFGWFGASYHVPCLVRDPSRPEAHGTVVEHFTENVDLLPTVAELLGVEVPRQCDGCALTPFLSGAVPDEWRDAAHWEFDWRFLAMLSGRPSGWPVDRRLERRNLVVRRTADRAYVQFGDGDAVAYDLAADPTWRTYAADADAAWADARALLAWRAEHAERTHTGTLIGPLGSGSD
ncbi:sulfatase-like hydrolase/transferase [Rhabdothermincola salaria]|uniref:sulfatase-like hydrolase/transferase n=1 Tax=Rhabdothermincola salaria TaxID=2903142 RepID=UPI001E302607|nr:sulfatase-like hydrolase/transferase [Rhabdothermincola salaria]